MKVAHLNTHTYGGAAIVAKRVHQALPGAQVDSLLITKFGTKKEKINNHIFFTDARILYFLRKFFSSPLLYPLAKFLQSRRTHPNLKNKVRSIEIFSPIYNGNFPDYATLKDVDIVHLHWVNNFVPYDSFFNTLSDKKFVWTIHDMNPITGGCHYADGCMKFTGECDKCPQLAGTIDESYSKKVQTHKIKGLGKLRDDQLTIVSPSQWLLNLSLQSEITKRFRHKLILNPSFKEFFLAKDQKSIRHELGLPLDKKILLFVADNLKAPRKGIPQLLQALQLALLDHEFYIVGIGHKVSSPENVNIKFTGSISNAELLSKYYSAADCFITTSLAENSPLVVIESLTCGTPVLGSDAGGISNLITDTNGILFNPLDAPAVAAAIVDGLFRKSFDRNRIKAEAVALHNPNIVSEEYKTLYREILTT